MSNPQKKIAKESTQSNQKQGTQIEDTLPQEEPIITPQNSSGPIPQSQQDNKEVGTSDDAPTFTEEDAYPDIDKIDPDARYPDKVTFPEEPEDTDHTPSTSRRHTIAAFRKDIQKSDQGNRPRKSLFPPTKKYRYYPVTCEYCRKRFQPNHLKAHQKKEHPQFFFGPEPSMPMSAATKRNTSVRKKNVGGIPNQLRACYICGQLYGSRSIKIHEPKCLEKWRVQNNQLPPHKRRPEPMKPQPITTAQKGSYGSLPEWSPENEAAFQSHERTLVPCDHCGRTFNPDRIEKHESCCIEKPKKREYITPEKDIKR